MEALTVDEWLVVPAHEMHLTFARSGGPGGQHANTTDTRVRLHFDVAHSSALPPGVRKRLLQALSSRLTNDGVLTITSDRYRSRHRNIEDVRDRLKELITEHRRPPKKRRPTKPSRAAKRRRLERKKRRSAVKANRRKPTREG